MTLAGYAARRLIAAVPTLIGITLITFLLLEILPGREAALAGPEGGSFLTGEAVARVRATYHLDEPAWRRYLEWLLRLCRWDLGDSILDGRPVSQVIQGAAVPTLVLNVVALAMAFSVSVPVGVGWARRRRAGRGGAGSLVSYLLYAFPNFAAALLLQQFFSVGLGLLPLQGTNDLPPGSPFWATARDLAAHLILPAVCLSYGSLAYLARFTRTNLLEVLTREHLLAARGRGIGETVLAWRHALRNALIPLITLLGLLVPALLGGSVLIETVFSWPGLGRLYFYSLQNRDFPVVLGLTTLTAILTLAGALLADLLCAIADPRFAEEVTR